MVLGLKTRFMFAFFIVYAFHPALFGNEPQTTKPSKPIDKPASTVEAKSPAAKTTPGTAAPDTTDSSNKDSWVAQLIKAEKLNLTEQNLKKVLSVVKEFEDRSKRSPGVTRMVKRSGSQAVGLVFVTENAQGHAQITGSVDGLKVNGLHGFHVHETGSCVSPDADSAGGHFNPTSKPHGDPAKGNHHVGDLPNIQADAKGKAWIEITSKNLKFEDLLGKSLIIHSEPDDFKSQPSGNAGPRISCGVITTDPKSLTNPTPNEGILKKQ